jgi:hypothetical protein
MQVMNYRPTLNFVAAVVVVFDFLNHKDDGWWFFL